MIKWGASPEIFKLGSMTFYWYGTIMVVSAIGKIAYIKTRFKAYDKDPELVTDLTLFFLFGMIIGARLVHCLFYEPAYYLTHPWEILKAWEGGLASHGGILGIALGAALFCRRKREISFWWLMDVLIGSAVFVGGLIRIGNFINSEVYGSVTALPWAVIFERVDHLPRHPTQIYEALGYFAMGIFLMKLERKKISNLAPGSLFSLALILVAGFRFLVEFLKAEYHGVLWLNLGQLLSLSFVVAGLGLWFWLNKRTPRQT